MKRLIVDLDGTLTVDAHGVPYSEKAPNVTLIQKLNEYAKNGFEIVISTARNMRTYEGNVGKINVATLPSIIDWLNKNNVPYSEVLVGKPWCGSEGFYLDDRAVRPSEFMALSYAEIISRLKEERDVDPMPT